jgi:hypothetical protein
VEKDLTIDEWCAKHGVSRGTWYNLQEEGKGPRFYYARSQVRITPEADAEWQAEREAETAAKPANPELSKIRRAVGAKGNATRIARQQSRQKRSA